MGSSGEQLDKSNVKDTERLIPKIITQDLSANNTNNGPMIF